MLPRLPQLTSTPFVAALTCEKARHQGSRPTDVASAKNALQDGKTQSAQGTFREDKSPFIQADARASFSRAAEVPANARAAFEAPQEPNVRAARDCAPFSCAAAAGDESRHMGVEISHVEDAGSRPGHLARRDSRLLFSRPAREYCTGMLPVSAECQFQLQGMTQSDSRLAKSCLDVELPDATLGLKVSRLPFFARAAMCTAPSHTVSILAPAEPGSSTLLAKSCPMRESVGAGQAKKEDSLHKSSSCTQRIFDHGTGSPVKTSSTVETSPLGTTPWEQCTDASMLPRVVDEGNCLHVILPHSTIWGELEEPLPQVEIMKNR